MAGEPEARVAAHEELRERILTGPLAPALLKLAWPTALTAALHGLVAAIDMIMVGRLGETAVAAVTAGGQAVMVLLIAGNAVAGGAGTLVARAIGAGERDRANHVLTQALLSYCVILLAVMMPLGWAVTPAVIGWLAGGEPGVVAAGVPYMRVVIGASVFTLLGFSVAGGLRGAGDTRTPLKFALAANLLNIPANYLCIFGVPALGWPGLGVVGAAWGTAIARAGSNLVLLAWLASGRLALRVEPLHRWRFDLQLLWEMARIGVPASLSGIVLNLYGMAVMGVLARTPDGSAALAGYGLGNTLRSFATWVTWGLADATMAVVGQNLGARQRRRARQVGFTAARLAAVYLLGIGAVLAALAPVVLPLILHEPDPARQDLVVAIAGQFLLFQAVCLPFLGVGMTLDGALRGTGDTVSPLVNNLVSLWLIGLPAAAVLALNELRLGPLTLPGCGLGVVGVWLGMGAAMIARGVTMTIKWRRTRWRAQPAN